VRLHCVVGCVHLGLYLYQHELIGGVIVQVRVKVLFEVIGSRLEVGYS
jgi:hypothetical protein